MQCKYTIGLCIVYAMKKIGRYLNACQTTWMVKSLIVGGIKALFAHGLFTDVQCLQDASVTLLQAESISLVNLMKSY